MSAGSIEYKYAMEPVEDWQMVYCQGGHHYFWTPRSPLPPGSGPGAWQTCKHQVAPLLHCVHRASAPLPAP